MRLPADLLLQFLQETVLDLVGLQEFLVALAQGGQELGLLDRHRDVPGHAPQQADVAVVVDAGLATGEEDDTDRPAIGQERQGQVGAHAPRARSAGSSATRASSPGRRAGR